MKNLIFFVLLIALSEIRAIAQGNCANANESCFAVQSSSYKSVFETLTTNSANRDHTLQLSASPASQFPFHLFRNGLELTPGGDYTLQGSVVTLTPKGVQGSGTIFEAAYVRQVSGLDSPASSNTSRTTGDPDRTEILNRYIQRSLEREMAQYTPLNSEQNPQRAPTANSIGTELRKTSLMNSRNSESAPALSPHRNAAGSEDYPESLRMLSDALSRSVAVPSNARNSKHHTYRNDDTEADGVEGLGDAPISSLYDILAEGTGGLGPALEQIDNQNKASSATSRSTHTTRLPESLRLLKQRLVPSTQD